MVSETAERIAVAIEAEARNRRMSADTMPDGNLGSEEWRKRQDLLSTAAALDTAARIARSATVPSKDTAEHPDHPHGSTVEQVHRILGQAYADEPDRWMLAEELVKFVTKQVAQGTTAADDAFLAELVQAFARPLTPEDLSAPTDRLSIVDSLIRAGRLKAGRPSTIPEHLAEAERLLAFAFIDNDPESAPGGYYVDDDHSNTQVAAAEVHARIAHAAAAAGMLRPMREEPENPEDRPGYVLLERLVLVLDRLAVALGATSTAGESDVD